MGHGCPVWGRPGAIAAKSRRLPSAASRNAIEDLGKCTCWPGGPRRRHVRSGRDLVPHGTLVFKFRGVDTISDAEQLCGAEVRVPVSRARRRSKQASTSSPT